MTTGKYFGTDGIRGPANQEPLTPDFAVRLGRAAAVVLGKEGGGRLRVVIGRDTRISGQMLEAALAAGLASAGADVDLLGVIPTPAVAANAVRLEADFAVVISASHNPAGDNGIKFFAGDGFKLPDVTEAAIESVMERPAGAGGFVAGDQVGVVRTADDAREAYLRFGLDSVPSLDLKGLTIVVDAAHGAASGITAEALTRLGATVVEVGNRPDGMNINNGVGCTHPSFIEAQVREHGADIGIAHDGDADRILLVDETGAALDGDEFLAIAGRHLASEGRLAGNTLVTTVMSNFGLDTSLREVGARVERTGVGDRYVIEAMREGGYMFGGEQSGHIIFREFTTTGDGLIAALQMLEILRKSGQKLSLLRKCLKKFPQAQKAVPVSSQPPLSEVSEIQRAIDKVEVELGATGRVLVRYSGTEPKLRILLEGPDEARLKELCEQLELVVRAAIG